MRELTWQLALLLVPFVALLLWALVDAIRRPAERMRYLPKWAWILIVLFGNSLGQIIYLAIGRDNTKPADTAKAADKRTVDSAVDSLYGEPKESRP